MRISKIGLTLATLLYASLAVGCGSDSNANQTTTKQNIESAKRISVGTITSSSPIYYEGVTAKYNLRVAQEICYQPLEGSVAMVLIYNVDDPNYTKEARQATRRDTIEVGVDGYIKKVRPQKITRNCGLNIW